MLADRSEPVGGEQPVDANPDYSKNTNRPSMPIRTSANGSGSSKTAEHQPVQHRAGEQAERVPRTFRARIAPGRRHPRCRPTRRWGSGRRSASATCSSPGAERRECQALSGEGQLSIIAAGTPSRPAANGCTTTSVSSRLLRRTTLHSVTGPRYVAGFAGGLDRMTAARTAALSRPPPAARRIDHQRTASVLSQSSSPDGSRPRRGGQSDINNEVCDSFRTNGWSATG